MHSNTTFTLNNTKTKAILFLVGRCCQVVDISTGERLGADNKGELRVKSACVMKGYLNNPEATKQAFDEEGYFRTGDNGTFNN